MCPFTRHTNTKLAIKVVFKRKSPNVNCWKHIRGNLAITSVKTKKIKKIQISLVKNDLIKLTKIFWPSSKIFSRFNFSLSLNDRNLNFPISEAPAHACYVISADQNKKEIFVTLRCVFWINFILISLASNYYSCNFHSLRNLFSTFFFREMLRSQKLTRAKIEILCSEWKFFNKKKIIALKKEKSNNTRSDCIIMWQAGICKHVRDFSLLSKDSTS
jgi:hypothetical protein